jgi:hypothetical protein
VCGLPPRTAGRETRAIADAGLSNRRCEPRGTEPIHSGLRRFLQAQKCFMQHIIMLQIREGLLPFVHKDFLVTASQQRLATAQQFKSAVRSFEVTPVYMLKKKKIKLITVRRIISNRSFVESNQTRNR